MIFEYTRELYNFDPLPFSLVSQDDHVAPVPDAVISLYYISLNGQQFARGLGGVRNAGQGFYELLLDKSEHVIGQVLVFIPAFSSDDLNYDNVSFRINFVPADEVVPVNQNSVFDMYFLMTSSEDHVSNVPGLIPSVSVSRDGSDFVHVSNTVNEIGLGFYEIEIPVFAEVPLSEFSNECVYTIKATSNGADTTYDHFQVFRYNYPS